MGKDSRTLIDGFIDWQGRASALLILPLCIVVIYEVVMRYIFNAPTTWGFELTTFLYGMHYMLGLGYTELHNGHVKVDIVTTRINRRSSAIISIATSCIIFLPLMILLTYATGQYAYYSTVQWERNPTSWAPAVWPVKIVMALSFLLLLLEGVSKLVHEIRALKNPQ